MKKTADIVIIGGGIIGTSLLYYLTEHGITDVELVEMDQIGSGSTSRSAAWITYQQLLEINILLTKLSMQEYLNFEEKFGVSISLEQPGTIQAGSKEMEIEMRKRADRQVSLGIPTEVLTTSEIKSMAPFLNIENIGIGLYCKSDARVDPHSIMQTYIKHAKLRGARVSEGIMAAGIRTRKNRVTGVETSQGIISSPLVVNAAGYRADEVGKWVGINIPLKRDVNHELITKATKYCGFPFLQILTPTPIYVGYYGPERNRLSIGIGTWEAEGYDQKADLNRLIQEFGEALAYRLPELEEMEITNYWAGIRPLNPDGLPILGPIEEVSGYINDCCWAGKGVAHAAASGILLSAHIAGDSEMPMAIEPFLFKRFNKELN